MNELTSESGWKSLEIVAKAKLDVDKINSKFKQTLTIFVNNTDCV